MGKAYGYYFTGGKQLERRDFSVDAVADGHVAVQVAGCGLCHTDISFINGSVKTKHELPLILGHEISGKVIAVGSSTSDQGSACRASDEGSACRASDEGSACRASDLMGKSVIVPAVLPCGECELCSAGRDNICQKQKMPGNDFHGGFASHVVVPARFLCVLPDDLKSFKLSQLSVIADAVTTPYQSMLRARIKKGDVAIVIGTGGIGLYMVQHAKNAGAFVLAIDIDEKKLRRACQQGADHGICSCKVLADQRQLRSDKEIKDQLRAFIDSKSWPQHQWKIFETSGTPAGQNLAFSLLTFASTLGIVGFTMEKTSIRLSNIMAFDADVFGNWGCRPVHYSAVAEQVLSGKIRLLENIEEYPLSAINDVISQAMDHKLEKRAIFIP